MATTNYVNMQQRRGPRATMPSSAPDGVLLIPTDTDELFVGTGTGVKKIGGTDNTHKTRYSLYSDNAYVYADGAFGAYDPRAREGWYFRNTLVGQKINWYYYDITVFSTTVANLKSAYAIVTPDTANVPYFAVYTAGNANVWFQSRRIYSNPLTNAVTGTKYLLHIGDDPGVYPELPRIKFNASSTTGAFADTETIAYVTLQTNSTPPGLNYYQFLVSQLGFKTNTVLREFDLKIKSDATLTVPITNSLSKWSITHNMGKRPSVTIVDEAGNIMFADVKYIDDSKLEINFSIAVKGSVYLN